MADYRLTKQAVKQLKKLNKSDKNMAIHIKSTLFSLSMGDITREVLQGYSDFLNI